jgi:HK97 family phage prohead protease
MIRQAYAGAIRQIGAREVRVRMCSRTHGRDNLIVEPAGIDLSDFRRNPIILRDHDQSKPVARAIGFDQRPDALDALIRFAAADISPLADETFALVKDGVLNAVSIGFEPVEKEPIDQHNRSAGTRITKSTLLECSFVGVPADPQALVLERAYRRQGMSLADHLDEIRGHLWKAEDHHGDLQRHLRNRDYDAAMRSHRELGRCLDRCERCLRNVSNDGMHADQEATAKSQNSDGMGYGVSAKLDGDRSALSYWRRQAELLRLAPPVVGDGGALGVARIREREFLQARVHIAGCAAAGCFRRATSRAERQAELAVLRRLY